jgi:twitching motility two-component system response regulator PilH
MLSRPLEKASKVRRGAPRRYSILIVDDDDALAEVLSIRLSRQGFTTTTAESGEAALKLARAERPDLILLDLRLPDIDGFELCQQLVDDEQTSEIPVIIVSGMEQPDIIRRSRAAGCHYFVHKPYDPNALLTLIQQALDEAKQG